MALTVGSLFAGIGGFDLGFERAGFEIKWQVEIDPFCRAVLAKHWPQVRRYEDVRECCTGTLRRSRDDQRCAECGRRDYLPTVDVLCGGFPCQPHSVAGRRLAGADDRDLWPEYARLIRELRPRWVVAENVPGLFSSDAGRFFGAILGDLAAVGYDAEWDCVSASDVGAPHLRDRVWIVAYPSRVRESHESTSDRHAVESVGAIARAGDRASRWRGAAGSLIDGGSAAVLEAHVADASGLAAQPLGRIRRLAGAASSREGREGERERLRHAADGRGQDLADADRERLPLARPEPHGTHRIFGGGMPAADSWWATEPDVGRVAHGVPARVDRLRGLGNAIVPQIAQWIAERIKAAEGVT